MNCITNWDLYHEINKTKEKTFSFIKSNLTLHDLSKIRNMKGQDNSTNHLPETNTD
ncbi:hypothetical protein BA6E_104176 [Bacteroidales bacterium 6E]|nr:hypothetical protein BA6E_104176 [Bacteroidales bacterium 6E]